MFTEDTATSVSRFAVIICEVKSTDVSPPTADAGHEVVLPPLIWVWQVGLPCVDWASGDPLPTLLVLAAVTLLWEVALLLNVIVVVAGFTEAETASFSRVRGSMGQGRVGGYIHVVSRLGEAGFGD
jgi:hypothetical protein